MFEYRLEHADGSPGDPPRFVSSTPTWRKGDRIFVSPTLRYHVLETREGVLVVERQ